MPCVYGLFDYSALSMLGFNLPIECCMPHIRLTVKIKILHLINAWYENYSILHVACFGFDGAPDSSKALVLRFQL